LMYLGYELYDSANDKEHFRSQIRNQLKDIVYRKEGKSNKIF